MRALSHDEDTDKEITGFIHPSNENPENHITFRNEFSVRVRGSIKGFLSIKYLDLNRTLLHQDRAERLSDLLALVDLAVKIPVTPPELKGKQSRR